MTESSTTSDATGVSETTDVPFGFIKDDHLPAVECAPWCIDVDGGHGDVTHIEDQRCISGAGLESMPLTAVDLRYDPYLKASFYSRLSIYLKREAYSTRTTVHLWHEGPRELDMTLEEAGRLRDALTELLEVAAS